MTGEAATHFGDQLHSLIFYVLEKKNIDLGDTLYDILFRNLYNKLARQTGSSSAIYILLNKTMLLAEGLFELEPLRNFIINLSDLYNHIDSLDKRVYSFDHSIILEKSTNLYKKISEIEKEIKTIGKARVLVERCLMNICLNQFEIEQRGDSKNIQSELSPQRTYYCECSREAQAKKWLIKAIKNAEKLYCSLLLDHSNNISDRIVIHLAFIKAAEISDKERSAFYRKYAAEVLREINKITAKSRKYFQPLYSNYIAMAKSYYYRENFAEKVKYYNLAIIDLKKQSTINKDNKDCFIVLADTYINLGLLAKRRVTLWAIFYFRKALRIMNYLLKIDPDNRICLEQCPVLYNELFNVEKFVDIEKAYQWKIETARVLEKLLPQEPQNEKYLSDISTIYYSIGKRERGKNFLLAKEMFEKSAHYKSSLIHINPENKHYYEELKMLYEELFETVRWHDYDGAKKWLNNLIELVERKKDIEGESCISLYKYDLLNICMRLGELDKYRNPILAKNYYIEATKIAEELLNVEEKILNKSDLCLVTYMCCQRLAELEVLLTHIEADCFEKNTVWSEKANHYITECYLWLFDEDMVDCFSNSLESVLPKYIYLKIVKNGVLNEDTILKKYFYPILSKSSSRQQKLAIYFERLNSIITALQDDALNNYKLAYESAQANRMDDAIKYLKKSCDEGYYEPEYTYHDLKLYPLQNTDEFMQVIETMSKKRNQSNAIIKSRYQEYLEARPSLFYNLNEVEARLSEKA